MIFLGSKEGFASHNGCSELLSIHMKDILLSLSIKKNNEIINTVIPTIYIPSNLKNLHNFPGIYSDQLPKKCFIDNDNIILTSPWGSVETLLKIDLISGNIKNYIISSCDNTYSIDFENENKDDSNNNNNNKNSDENIVNKMSCSILDMAKNQDVSVYTHNILLSISSPSSPPKICILKLKNENEKEISQNENVKNVILTTKSILKPMAITRKKMMKSVILNSEKNENISNNKRLKFTKFCIPNFSNRYIFICRYMLLF